MRRVQPSRGRGSSGGGRAVALLVAVACAAPGAVDAAPSAVAPSPGPAPIAIDRGEALAALRRPDRLAGEMWLASPDAEAIKARARGEAVKSTPPTRGLELRGIRPDGWPHRLGLRTGDVLQRLDGTDIDGLPTLIAVALRLQARLAAEDSFTFDARVVRAGRPLELRYAVSDPRPPQAPATPAAPSQE